MFAVIEYLTLWELQMSEWKNSICQVSSWKGRNNSPHISNYTVHTQMPGKQK